MKDVTIGCLITFILTFLLVAKLSNEADKKIVKAGYFTVEGVTYRVTPIDTPQ